MRVNTMESLEEQSFRNLVVFYAEELRDIHAGKRTIRSMRSSSRILFKHGLFTRRGGSESVLSEKALKVLEEEGGDRDG